MLYLVGVRATCMFQFLHNLSLLQWTVYYYQLPILLAQTPVETDVAGKDKILPPSKPICTNGMK